MNCPLCESNALAFATHLSFEYFQCVGCRSVFMHPCHRLPPKEEKSRYLEHDNDVTDVRYQAFVKPLVRKVQKEQTPSDSGLDFGAGTGPVASYLLRNRGYDITCYDPYFHKHEKKLDQRYDYIICVEVIEHFYEPKSMFDLLCTLLNKKGRLYCMTRTFTSSIRFSKWGYKNDPTHVFFYHEKAYQYIIENTSFTHWTASRRLVTFTK